MFAGIRDIQRKMVRIGTEHIILVMAIAAYGGRAGISRFMTIDTGCSKVSPGQGEIGIVVVKGRWFPGALGMAQLAIDGKLCCLVIRICRLVIIRLMASEAGIGSVVVIPSVAFGTIGGNGGMGSL